MLNPLHTLFRCLQRPFAVRAVLCMCMITLLFSNPGEAHNVIGDTRHVDEYGYAIGDDGQTPEPDNVPFDETSVFINVQRVGGTEVPAVIKDRMVYLPVSNFFNFLKIRNIPSTTLDSISGYFIDPAAVFCIDNVHSQISYKGKVTRLQPGDIIQTESNLYLKAEYFNFIFGLTCDFDFSNLSVKISTTYDLPVIRELQMEQIHHNISRLKGEIKADTTIKRSYPLFRMGLADWTATATQQSTGYKDLRVGMALGAVIAGGEANATINYSSNEPFSERQQFYQWRLANNDRKALRQITLGRIFTQATSAIYDPVIGVQLTNTPTTYRRSFGTYRLSKTTQPGWTVELYVNGVLVDYAKADASGFFSFDVPLVYGNSIVKIRYYGLFGEEHTSEENITIPFNFLPQNELEYTVSAGIVEDSVHSRLARAVVNYGLTRKITIGGGTEYRSSLTSGRQMPFLNASVRLTSDLMLSGSYTYGVMGTGILTYRMPFNAQLELNYVRYAKDQKALIYNYLEERKAIVSVPFHSGGLGLVTRLMLDQIIVTENTHYTTAEWLVSGNMRNVNASINTYLISVNQYDPPKFDPYIYSNVSLGFRLPKGYSLTPQAQYSYKDREFISAKCELEKSVFGKGFLNVSFEQNFKSNIYSMAAGFRYDLSFARVAVSARRYNDVSEVTAAATGSLIYDSKTGYHGFGNRPGIGRAGITIVPYLDINANGHRDKGEPKVDGLKVRINSGRIEYSKRDTVIRLYDLEPYTNYFVDISQNSFEHIGWQIKNKTMNIAADPNQFKLIEVPVVVLGEASGTVYLKEASGKRGLGRISVCFYRADNTLAGCGSTDPDGYFSFMGLAPGHYTVRPDQAQLTRLHMSAYPESLPVTILPSTEGVLLESLDFTIQPAGQPLPVSH